jgi:hypothetical protein
MQTTLKSIADLFWREYFSRNGFEMKNRKFTTTLILGFALLLMGCTGQATVSSASGQEQEDTGGAGQPSEEPVSEPEDEEQQEPEDTRKIINLDCPSIKEILAYVNGKITLKWNAVKKADYYEVYRSTSKSKGYKKLAATKKNKYTDKKGKKYQKYYYKIIAVAKENESRLESRSKYSKIVSKVCRHKPSKSAFAGDSVMTGFSIYNVLGRGERSFARTSLRVSAMYSEYLSGIQSYDPDRVYIMIGTNEVVGNPSKATMKTRLAKYDDFIEKIHEKNKNVEVVVMAIGPTRNCARITNSTVNRYNKLLKKIAKKYSYAVFYDTARILKDSSGSLKSSYAAGDGIHWSPAAYRAVYKDVKKFLRAL